MFITFEGGEGSGKTTQAKLLVENLKKNGINSIFTREPGGTPLAEKIRELILGGRGIDDPLTEFLLISAARRDHVRNFIKPNLEAGAFVICDRFIDSSVAYQGSTKGLDVRLIRKLHKEIFDDFAPDMTILIDIEPELGLKRIRDTRALNNYYDAQDISFHNKVREGLLTCAEYEPNRFRVIDGSQDMDSIAQEIYKLVVETSIAMRNNPN
jgi:dTMP kinase